MDLLAWIRTSSRRRRRGIDEKEKVYVDCDGAITIDATNYELILIFVLLDMTILM